MDDFRTIRITTDVLARLDRLRERVSTFTNRCSRSDMILEAVEARERELDAAAKPKPAPKKA